MPGFNRTGPLGYGPRTGRGMGPGGRGLEEVLVEASELTHQYL